MSPEEMLQPTHRGQDLQPQLPAEMLPLGGLEHASAEDDAIVHGLGEAGLKGEVDGDFSPDNYPYDDQGSDYTDDDADYPGYDNPDNDDIYRGPETNSGMF